MAHHPTNHPAHRKGRALPRAGAATADGSALSRNPSHRSSGDCRCKAPSRAEGGRGPAGFALDSGPTHSVETGRTAQSQLDLEELLAYTSLSCAAEVMRREKLKLAKKMLSTLQEALHESIIEQVGSSQRDSEELEEKLSELFEAIQEKLENDIALSHKKSAPIILQQIREMNDGFEERNFARWKPSFDHLEMMWSVAQELGEMHGKDVKEEAEESGDTVMAALANIFPRALLVAQEVICLLKGGFADGALARWRSLHELTVTAMYISKHGEKAAVAYLLSFHFAARRAAHQLNEFSERARMDKFSQEDMKGFDERCEVAEQILGRKIEKDKLGEWPAITQTHSTFADLELDVGMDHWRPRYKWASAHTHAHHRPSEKLLGMVEATDHAHLVGASNSGLVDPFQMTAIALSQITAVYLLHTPNIDRIVHSQVLLKFADEMSTIAMENEKATREAFDKATIHEPE